MALLAGSRIAHETLQLAEGPARTLPELFPTVQYINRLSLRSGPAREVLDTADAHLAQVAVPYALAIHEDYVMDAIALLREERLPIIDGGKPHKPWNMHEVLFDSTRFPRPVDWLQSFHLLREMRNCAIHSGGRADQKLRKCIADMGAGAAAGWRRQTGYRPEAVLVEDKVTFMAAHIFVAFAVTKNLGELVNEALLGALPRDRWASEAVADFSTIASWTRNSSTWRRKLTGYVRHHYASLRLSEDELEAAARANGAWTLDRWK